MKRNQDPASDDGEQENVAPKRRKKSKPLFEPHQDVNLEKSIDLAIGRMNSRLLADYVARQTKRFGSNLSPLELHDLTIPGRGADLSGCLVHFRSVRLIFAQKMPLKTRVNGLD